MKLSTFLFASIMLMACYRNKKQPEDYLYKQGTSNHIYFQKEEGKTIYCTLKKGSSISFDCQDNGYTYVYSPDSNLTYSGKMPFIPADTSYIEYYGKRFYPRVAKLHIKNGSGYEPAPLKFTKGTSPDMTVDSSIEFDGEQLFWTTHGERVRMIPDTAKRILIKDTTISNTIIDANLINRVRGIPQPSPVPDTLPDSLASSRQYREWVKKDTIPKPTYEYVYKTTIPINQLQPTLDTINMIVSELGTDMMVSRKNALTALMARKVGILLGRPVVDSVKVGGGR